ncbi:hypothetical protein [Shewanella algae]|uniref:hypothetical protein n=1 Tax=Shewanella algae TaxID=38313 RepID=UPI0031F585C3
MTESAIVATLLLLILAAYMVAKNSALRKQGQRLQKDLVEAKEAGENLAKDIEKLKDKLHQEQEKNWTIESRLKAESKGFMPRIFSVSWDTRHHACTGYVITDCPTKVPELIREGEIKEVKEIDITYQQIIGSSGWSHSFR